MMILDNYSYHRPHSVEEALNLLKEEGSLIIAGGSDVMPQLKMATIAPKMLIDLADVSELHQVSEDEAGIHIGAMATLSSLSKNELILSRVPAVSEAARNVASPQIRNRGTIAGNVLQARRCFYYNQTKEWRRGIPQCFKVGGKQCLQIPNSPVCRAIYYSDMTPVLLAYGAQAVLTGENAEQTVSCWNLMMQRCKDQDEKVLVREFLIPRENYTNAWAEFKKYSLRGGIDFPMINFAGVYQPNRVSLMVGAIATHVLELSEAESYLLSKGRDFSVDEACETAVAEMKKKSQIIRESGISVPVKRGSFSFVRELLEDLKAELH